MPRRCGSTRDGVLCTKKDFHVGLCSFDEEDVQIRRIDQIPTKSTAPVRAQSAPLMASAKYLDKYLAKYGREPTAEELASFVKTYDAKEAARKLEEKAAAAAAALPAAAAGRSTPAAVLKQGTNSTADVQRASAKACFGPEQESMHDNSHADQTAAADDRMGDGNAAPDSSQARTRSRRTETQRQKPLRFTRSAEFMRFTRELMRRRVRVLWEEESTWYEGVVREFDPISLMHTVLYLSLIHI